MFRLAILNRAKRLLSKVTTWQYCIRITVCCKALVMCGAQTFSSYLLVAVIHLARVIVFIWHSLLYRYSAFIAYNENVVPLEKFAPDKENVIEVIAAVERHIPTCAPTNALASFERNIAVLYVVEFE